ncbi:MAG: TatD family deoxyribonuclease [Spirochaetae bacterium HGW-Spirochaetae-4]|jgi:TatD DNase family protein|nr:MAG: TatD family deoxyribonuclease [Spirochaetae bacterium HGW-Spirochaetae-4]HCS35781.1 TatD family deoxyribonuclease [Sphaerochaeta sp.]
MHGLIDSHFHLLEMEKKGIDPKKLLIQLHEAGFAGGIDIGVSENDIAIRAPLVAPYPNIRTAAGIGPWGADGEEAITAKTDRFQRNISGFRVDCIGEIGLDYHWNYGTPARQRQLFEEQLSLARELEVPVVIHSRDADEDMIEILGKSTFSHAGIMHCFSSGWALAQTAIDRGLYISFAGPITYKNNHGLREMLARVPIERLLLETDSPYLAPTPHRGKTNTPFTMVEIYSEAARILGIGVEDLSIRIRTNFANLFGSPGRS